MSRYSRNGGFARWGQKRLRSPARTYRHRGGAMPQMKWIERASGHGGSLTAEPYRAESGGWARRKVRGLEPLFHGLGCRKRCRPRGGRPPTGHRGGRGGRGKSIVSGCRRYRSRASSVHPHHGGYGHGSQGGGRKAAGRPRLGARSTQRAIARDARPTPPSRPGGGGGGGPNERLFSPGRTEKTGRSWGRRRAPTAG